MPTFILKISKEKMEEFHQENLERCKRWPGTFNEYASNEFLISDKLGNSYSDNIEIIRIDECHEQISENILK